MAPTYASEVDRQQAYLNKLPNDYQYPLFNSKQALMSQRNNGYRNTATAAREIVDNAIEAGATRIDVVLDRIDSKKRRKHQNADTVENIAFIDNGSGMLPNMARYAMSWGGGTHFENPDEIGKFGFGLPNASINQTRKVAVYTRTEEDQPVTMVRLDLDAVNEHGTQSIPEPVEAKLPSFVERYLKDQNLPFKSGTVVVWEQPDRLTYSTAGSLKPHMLNDFGAAYRNFLDEIDIFVDKSETELVDPLFLNPMGRYYVKPEEGGATQTQSATIPVILYKDVKTGNAKLKRLESEKELDNFEAGEIEAHGFISIKVSRLPYNFAIASKNNAKKLGDESAWRRWEIRKPRRGLSFVRAKREIETVDNFPRSAQDKSSGLGHWPLLQSYAYHWAAEVQFSPDLDAAFGITNDKQNVRPIEDFWRVLAEEGVDQWLKRENNWQTAERNRQKELQKQEEAEREEESDAPTLGQTAAAAAEAASGSKNSIPPHEQEEAAQEENEYVEQEAERTDTPEEEIRKKIRERAKVQPYKVEFFDNEYGPFYEPKWGMGEQIILRINRSHAFYKSIYSKLYPAPSDGDVIVRHGIDLMLYTLARSEKNTRNPETTDLYATQRTSKWSPFLASALKHMERQFEDDDFEDDSANQEDNEENEEAA